MTPDCYLSQLKIYSRFVRNFNQAQQVMVRDHEPRSHALYRSRVESDWRNRKRRVWRNSDRAQGKSSACAGAILYSPSPDGTTPILQMTVSLILADAA